MPKHSKRFEEASSLIDKKQAYSVEEAVDLLKKTATTKFDASIEIHFKLGIDARKGDQAVRSSVVLPHGTGKTKKIAVVTKEDKQKEAKDAGADIVGEQEFIDEIKKTEKTDFDVLIATPDVMRNLAPIAKILGTRGLMPSPKSGTVVTNIAKAVEEIKKGKVVFKNDDTANIHSLIGKVSFDNTKLIENINAFVDAVTKAKPSATKGTYIKTITLASAMGPGLKITF